MGNTKWWIRGVLVALLSIAASASFAQTNPAPTKSLAASAGVMVYPTQGQKPDQQTKDEAECFNWAKQQSGYDPVQPPKSTAAPAQAGQAAQQGTTPADGKRARGALRGAAGGAIIAEVAGNDAGKGAAIGATAGAMAGGRRSRMAQSQQQQQAQQAQASAAQAQAAEQAMKDAFKRGISVCLEARGYSVK